MDSLILQLVRLGIGHDSGPLPPTIDWDAVQVQSSRQGITAIVWDASLKLYDQGLLADGRLLDVPLKKQWIGIVYQNYERKYDDYRKAICKLAAFYNRHGFRLMVLKGYGLSLYYPVPEHRPCGDIDIWAFGQYREADAAIEKELGISIDKTHHHHTVFSFRGYSVENHYDFVNVHGHRSSAKIEKIFKQLAESDEYFTVIDGEKVYLPSPDLHALFLLRHTMSHFASTSMSLRQILDWAFFVEKNTDSIHWDWLQDVLEQFHMTDFFRCMNAICVEDLGVDSSLFPLNPFSPALKERVLADTLSPEFDEPAPVGRLKNFVFKYRRWRANNWKHRMCYKEGLLDSFITLGLSHIIGPGEE